MKPFCGCQHQQDWRTSINRQRRWYEYGSSQQSSTILELALAYALDKNRILSLTVHLRFTAF